MSARRRGGGDKINKVKGGLRRRSGGERGISIRRRWEREGEEGEGEEED